MTKTANEFLHYLNSCHSNIKCAIEFEQNNAILFLDILVTRSQNNIFMTSIYRLCSSGSLLQSALNDLQKLLLQNGYPKA